MDLDLLNHLARFLASAGSRRQLLGLLAAVPAMGGLLGHLAPEDAETKERRRRRKQRHKRRKDPGKHKGKTSCKSKPKSQTCAGNCGGAPDNCKKAVNCGPCACDPTCGPCFVCQDQDNASGTCVPDPAQQGAICGSPGQVCQADGACTCDADSCPNPTPICDGGGCVACSATNPCPAGQCCAGDGSCVASCPTGCCQVDGLCGACLVFVTSTTSGPALGGVDSADDHCQDLATAAELPGTYLAWLSTTGSPSPATRFKQVTSPYLLVDGTTQVADKWSDLVNGSLDHAINMNESGVTVASGYAWTGTLANGQATSVNTDCEDWLLSSASQSGIVGVTDATNSSWSNTGTVGCNFTDARLYCFQQT